MKSSFKAIAAAIAIISILGCCATLTAATVAPPSGQKILPVRGGATADPGPPAIRFRRPHSNAPDAE